MLYFHVRKSYLIISPQILGKMYRLQGGKKTTLLKISRAESLKNKHNMKLQRADPGTKDMGKFSTRGHIFLLNAQNGFLLFTSLYLRKNTTLN